MPPKGKAKVKATVAEIEVVPNNIKPSSIERTNESSRKLTKNEKRRLREKAEKESKKTQSGDFFLLLNKYEQSCLNKIKNTSTKQDKRHFRRIQLLTI